MVKLVYNIIFQNNPKIGINNLFLLINLKNIFLIFINY